MLRWMDIQTAPLLYYDFWMIAYLPLSIDFFKMYMKSVIEDMYWYIYFLN